MWKLHAFGNWEVNVDNEVKEVNPFLHKNCLVTAAYNFFGFTMFPRSFEGWKKHGLLSKEWDPMVLKRVILHGVKENVLEHSHIVDLISHSELVRFVTEIRAIFHVEFNKYKNLFPGVNTEGLFVGTIFVQLMMPFIEWHLGDPLWFDVTDPKVGKMVEMVVRIVRVDFTCQVPGYSFHRYFRG